MLTNGMHNYLWSEGAKALPNIAEQLERIAGQIAMSNITTILKECYELGELSKEDYVKELTEGLDIIKKIVIFQE